MRQHTSAYVSIRAIRRAARRGGRAQATPSAYVSIRQHTPACVSIRQHTSAYVPLAKRVARLVEEDERKLLHLHTSAYVRIRQHTSVPI
jgi:hypothetical protein